MTDEAKAAEEAKAGGEAQAGEARAAEVKAAAARIKPPRAEDGIPDTGEHPVVRAPSHFWTHDLAVLLAAALLLVGGWLAHRAVARPRLARFDHQGLTFAYPAGWLPGGGDPEQVGATLRYESVPPGSRLEVKIAGRPVMGPPLSPILDIARSRAYGQLYKRLESENLVRGGHEWLRTRYVYAYQPTADDAPAVAMAVEYATLNGERMYVVTVHGSEAGVEDLESDILHTLAVK